MEWIDKTKLFYFLKEAITILCLSIAIFIILCIFRLLSFLSFLVLGPNSFQSVALKILEYIHIGWLLGSILFLTITSFIKLGIMCLGSIKNEA